MAEIKEFFDVFPGFQCPKEIMDLFEQVQITEAVLVKSEKTLKIYMKSKILIEKQDIYLIEDLLSDFVFKNNMRVKLIEKYDLSNQYDISKLTDLYKESLLFELQAESSVLYRLVKNAEWYIDGNVITLTLDDTFLAKNRSEDIKRYLETVYLERFGYEIQAGFDFTEEQKDMIRRANEHKLHLEVSNIMEQVEKNQQEFGDEKETANKNSKEKNQGEPRQKSSISSDVKKDKQSFSEQRIKENRWNRAAYGRTKINDPEVIYGGA